MCALSYFASRCQLQRALGRLLIRRQLHSIRSIGGITSIGTARSIRSSRRQLPSNVLDDARNVQTNSLPLFRSDWCEQEIMGMTKIEILADLSGWLVRSGYLALKVVSSSGKNDKFFLFSLPSPDHLDQEYTGRRNYATTSTKTVFFYFHQHRKWEIFSSSFPYFGLSPPHSHSWEHLRCLLHIEYTALLLILLILLIL